MRAKIAVIGGTSLFGSSLFSHLQEKIVETPFGKVIVYTDGDEGKLVFVQRHHADGENGSEMYRPPHLINHRANFHAISQFNVDAVIAVASVGSLQKSIHPGTLIIPDDYFSICSPLFSVYDDQRAHIVPSFDAPLRGVIIDTLNSADLRESIIEKGVYVQTSGPRFETPREIHFLSSLGDIVGMTCANEATAAKELKLRYAIIAMVDNMGNGLASRPLTPEEFLKAVQQHQSVIESAVGICLKRLVTHEFE